MRQEIEAFLTTWVQENPPQPRKSDTQVWLENLVPTITDLRRKGYGWPQLATMFAEFGLTDAYGQRMKAETLRRKAVRAGYPDAVAGQVSASSAATKLDEPDGLRSDCAGQAAPVTSRSRPTEPPMNKEKGSTSNVFSSANGKRRPRRREELAPYSTADVTQDANQELAEADGGK